jgi:exportin-1
MVAAHPFLDIAEAYESSGDSGQELVLNLALFLSNFLSFHLRAVETSRSKDVLLNAHLYVVKISQVEEREIFKICMEYWIRLVAELYEEIQNLPIGEEGLLKSLSLGGTSAMLDGVPLRRDIYVDVLSNLRLVVIERMVKPEEVCLIQVPRTYGYLIPCNTGARG